MRELLDEIAALSPLIACAMTARMRAGPRSRSAAR